MRFLAIDPGTRRVGLAVGDDATKLASPRDVLEISSPARAIELILPIIAREAVDRLVIGLPMNMDGTIGPPATEAIRWGRALAGQAGLPVVFVDERLSSFAAEQQLIERRRAGEKLTHGRKKQQRDALAAAAFLQDYLDGKLAGIDADSIDRS